MGYDEALAHWIREQLADLDGVTEKPMFGGLAFLVHGNMAVSVSSRGGLIVRVGPEAAAEALARPHAEPLRTRGRPMGGWVLVAPEGVNSKRQLHSWVRRGVEFARTLPPKRG